MTICLTRFRDGCLVLSSLSLEVALAEVHPVAAEPPSYPGYAAASRSSEATLPLAENLAAVRRREIRQGVKRPDPKELANPTSLKQNAPGVYPPLMPGATQSTLVTPANRPKPGPGKPPKAKVKTDLKIKS